MSKEGEADIGPRSRIPLGWVVGGALSLVTLVGSGGSVFMSLMIKAAMTEERATTLAAAKEQSDAALKAQNEKADAQTKTIADGLAKLEAVVTKQGETMDTIKENTFKTALKAESASQSLSALQSGMGIYATREYLDGLKNKADVEHADFRKDIDKNRADIESLKKDVADLKSGKKQP